jgi:hypothetical protein
MVNDFYRQTHAVILPQLLTFSSSKKYSTGVFNKHFADHLALGDVQNERVCQKNEFLSNLNKNLALGYLF